MFTYLLSDTAEHEALGLIQATHPPCLPLRLFTQAVWSKFIISYSLKEREAQSDCAENVDSAQVLSKKIIHQKQEYFDCYYKPCDLDLADRNPFFSNNTLASDDAPPYQVWSQKLQRF